MPTRIQIEVDDDDFRYFDACARIRNISPRSLFRRLMKTVATDQMVASILDDEGDLRRRGRGEHRYRSTRRGNSDAVV
ncbi:hypothetical protein [Bradyrhizobium japonicum]|uniref:hypothetical protein n=1 Tax=Bradyrhizobium japonicum TaxID=375 RepID=UPI0004628A19|nr:hypothetical protein [Bradyrhizobium japonicum]